MQFFPLYTPLYQYFSISLSFSILEIIFLHYVARSFCEAFKLPKELPKIAKCLKCLKLRNSIDFIFIKKKNKLCNYIHLLISYFSCCKYQTFIIKTERSDTIILGILAHFRHFRHFPGLSGLPGLGICQ